VKEIHQGSERDSLGVVKEIHQGSERDSHKPVNEPVNEPVIEPKDINFFSQYEKTEKSRKTKVDQKAILQQHGIDDQLADDFIALRKQKKAIVSITAMAGIAREADKAGISTAEAVRFSVECGWQGFRADWYQSKQKSRNDLGGNGSGLPSTKNKGGSNYDRKPRISEAEWWSTDF